MGESAGSWSLSVPGVPASVAVTRRTLRSWLTKSGIACGLIDDVVLCASEAVTNAIQHGYRGAEGTVLVSVHLADEGVVLTVVDEGDWLPTQDGIGVSHGWGLPLIEAICRTVDLTRTLGKTVLTARLGMAT
ncbi:ATP-binding protein [Actinokineospora globicatena]|uniref:Histidine kinase/HSP90-like ATPase domain-containing protein n=1 Tax=Actinokineospora globicatena TaxID=103729 RepID=A0A9W6V762_9PSEU|nr:ATP-binding protein [Actinokineospora globicatena]MCP2303810.1 Anti-sigma regulatory factor (Ser/Thr protein kinase) [Actinokineospora globicatena]GLW79037.1 hypothetical protein Aglo01_35190 [Actinokineospora globicatena]GLW86552.1 hypothetical protein Aglo02_41910 [Actinokineospora globicatena]GLW89659.1 hypothetical protein Aglo03_04750 [Actinokineospora globicatena]